MDTPARRLYRSRTERVFFGVAGGLGDYFSVDPVLIRVGFVLLAMAGGMGFLGYIILIFVIPPSPESVTSHPAEEFREAAKTVRRGAKAVAEEARQEFDKIRHEPWWQARGNLLGGLFILIGAWLLLDRLLPDFFHTKFMGPAALILIGFWLLAKKTRA